MKTQASTNRKNLLIAAGAVAAGTAATLWFRRTNQEHDPLPTAPLVDLNQYMGEWYEVARLPVSYMRKLRGHQAIYTMQPDGSVEVLNSCYKGSLDGPPGKPQRARLP